MSSTWSAVLILIIKPDTSKSSSLSFCLCLPACLSVWLQYACWLILSGEPNDWTLPSLPDGQRCCVMTLMGLNDWYGLRWVWMTGMDFDRSEWLVWIAMGLNDWYGSIVMVLNDWYGLRWSEWLVWTAMGLHDWYGLRWVYMTGMDCDGSTWLVWIAMGQNDRYGLRWVRMTGMDCDGSKWLVWIAMGLNDWYGLRWV